MFGVFCLGSSAWVTNAAPQKRVLSSLSLSACEKLLNTFEKHNIQRRPAHAKPDLN